jgi:aspartate racemase
VIILGCTEIPLVLTDAAVGGIPLIDPTLILARALIREAAPDRLRTLTLTTGLKC